MCAHNVRFVWFQHGRVVGALVPREVRPAAIFSASDDVSEYPTPPQQVYGHHVALQQRFWVAHRRIFRLQLVELHLLHSFAQLVSEGYRVCGDARLIDGPLLGEVLGRASFEFLDVHQQRGEFEAVGIGERQVVDAHPSATRLAALATLTALMPARDRQLCRLGAAIPNGEARAARELVDRILVARTRAGAVPLASVFQRSTARLSHHFHAATTVVKT